MKDIQIITFLMDTNCFGINIFHVLEVILPPQDIVKIPDVPHFIDGLINFRGKIIPVVNVRIRFNIEPVSVNKKNRILITTVKEKILGLLVEEVFDVTKLVTSKIENVSDVITGVPIDYLEGVVRLNDKVILILALEKIFSVEELTRISLTPNKAELKNR